MGSRLSNVTFDDSIGIWSVWQEVAAVISVHPRVLAIRILTDFASAIDTRYNNERVEKYLL